MNSFSKSTLVVACAAVLSMSGTMARASEEAPSLRPYSVDPALLEEGYFQDGGGETTSSCIPDGGVDDTLSQTFCCSGYAVNGSTVCSNPADYGTTWASCRHVCGTAPVNGCIPSGGIDDTLGSTSCCSGSAVSGSTWCLDPADYGTDWKSCVQTCQ